MSILRRRMMKKYPAPAPTPEGMVYATKRGGETKLFNARKLHENCKAEMDAFDALPEAARAMLREIDRSAQDQATQEKAKANAKTAPLGFARAF